MLMTNMTVAGYQFDPDMAMILAEKAAMVLGILLVTWVLAKAAKWAFAKLVDTISFFRRGTSSGESVGMMLGRVVSLLVWLFGLVAILNVLNLGSVTGPVENMLTSVLDFVPNLIGAGIIFFVGSMIAKIVKELVETAMMTVDLDKWANKGGVETVTGNSTISKTIGTIVYVLIIIPVAVAALQALQIESISTPLVNMLTVILNAIPNIIGAAIILGLGYVLARWVANLVQDILPGLGIDRSVAALGVLPDGTTVSSITSKVAMVAIMLISAIAATRLLQFPELTNLVNEVLGLGSKVIFGGVVIAIGLLVANMLSSIVSGASGAGMGANIVRYATIILFAAMGLTYMGIAPSIIEMSFGALVIGGAAAFALAFGLGGKDQAAKVLADIRNTPSTPGKPVVAKPVPTMSAAAVKTVAKKPAVKKASSPK
jgi:Conserved TM helix